MGVTTILILVAMTSVEVKTGGRAMGVGAMGERTLVWGEGTCIFEITRTQSEVIGIVDVSTGLSFCAGSYC